MALSFQRRYCSTAGCMQGKHWVTSQSGMWRSASSHSGPPIRGDLILSVTRFCKTTYAFAHVRHPSKCKTVWRPGVLYLTADPNADAHVHSFHTCGCFSIWRSFCEWSKHWGVFDFKLIFVHVHFWSSMVGFSLYVCDYTTLPRKIRPLFQLLF